MVAFRVTGFRNGERRVTLLDDVSGRDVTIRLDITSSPDTDLIDFLLKIDALVENGVRQVHVVVPYLPYSLQNRHFDGEPVSARMVARLLSVSGAYDVTSVDLHEPDIAKFFTIPFRNMSPIPLFSSYLLKHDKPEVIVAPDKGAASRARELAKTLGISSVIVGEKSRDHETHIKQYDIPHLDKVKGKRVVVVDDMVNTGGTLVKLAQMLRRAGATTIIVCVTHLLPVTDNLKDILPNVDVLVATDSVPQGKLPSKVVVLPLTKLLV